MPSNIRASVHWKDNAVFSGEEIECVITFRNVAKSRNTRETDRNNASIGPKQRTRIDAIRPHVERQRSATQSTGFTRPQLGRAPSVTSARNAPNSRGHGVNHSMSVAPNMSHGRSPSTASVVQTATNAAPKHGRSLSIMSLGSEGASQIPNRKSSGGAVAQRARGHGRSASMQMTARATAPASPELGR